MRKRPFIFISASVAVAAVILVLLLARGWISEHVYDREVDKLVGRFSAEQLIKYEKEIRYIMQKFWSCYEEGIVTQNDMNDVMEKMRQLSSKSRIEKKELYGFADFVSNTFSEAIQKYQEKTFDGR